MNEKNTTYIYLKHLPSKKHMPKEKIKGPPMYSEVKNTTSNSNQTKITRNKSSKRKVPSVPFTQCLTVVIIGIFCFFLLVTTGILGLMVFQGHHKCQPQKPPLEDNSMLKNIPVVVEPFNTGNNSTCERKWSCCGEKCYYFSHELKSFEESRRSCNKMNSALLKIDDEKELVINLPSDFLEKIIIPLRKLRNTALPLNLSNWQEPKSGNCARMTARKMVASECSKSSYYVCEKLSSTEGSWETRADNIGSPEESPSSPEHAHPVQPPSGAHLFYLDQSLLERKLYCTDTVSSVPFTWCLNAVILGIFCSFLLVTTRILGFMDILFCV
ncbi:C-type lectin domain family 7 member A-like [Phyllostomus hastatus]|uniref:C-type lectin domain family 7 member A-like n=1 Tax=Phyllostomus hastatus TaxID=9423 RepID=UPI001E681AF7|nr:C-type lectin domain family 7 member A-like [Phyllostomus hastatus]